MREALATPPEGLRPPGEHRATRTGATRKPMALWDRVKFLILLAPGLVDPRLVRDGGATR